MPTISNLTRSIGAGYPEEIARLKHVSNDPSKEKIKIALMGDSTLDNGYWIQKNQSYKEKTGTVTHQTAAALTHQPLNYDVANFAVDGAVTKSMTGMNLDAVVQDEDHSQRSVNQIDSAINHWKPDVAVLSIGG